MPRDATIEVWALQRDACSGQHFALVARGTWRAVLAELRGTPRCARWWGPLFFYAGRGPLRPLMG